MMVLRKSHGKVPTQYQTYPEMGFSMGFYRDFLWDFIGI